MASLASRLEGLGLLHGRGLLSAEEFARAKARVIAEHGRDDAPSASATAPTPGGPPPAAAQPAPPPLNPVVPGVGLALGAAASGGLMG
ncbi:MAG TPA: hypothetical protein VF143_10550 [Candidatus Nanopelagicales bacterium]